MMCAEGTVPKALAMTYRPSKRRSRRHISRAGHDACTQVEHITIRRSKSMVGVVRYSLAAK